MNAIKISCRVIEVYSVLKTLAWWMFCVNILAIRCRVITILQSVLSYEEAPYAFKRTAKQLLAALLCLQNTGVTLGEKGVKETTEFKNCNKSNKKAKLSNQFASSIPNQFHCNGFSFRKPVTSIQT